MSSIYNPYNEYNQIQNMSYNIISHLVLNNDNLWKILKYQNSNALNQPNLTQLEKSNLIYESQEDSTPYRCFQNIFMDDLFQERQSQIRIYLAGIKPTNYVYGCLDFGIEILSHNKICALDGYLDRNVVMLNEIIKTLNGKSIQGLGVLSFDYGKSTNNRANIVTFNKYFQGYRLLMSTFTG
jgi:hypothetical protein